jgi:hypothetical protein
MPSAACSYESQVKVMLRGQVIQLEKIGVFADQLLSRGSGLRAIECEALFLSAILSPNLVRLDMDEKRFERDAAETKRKQAMLYLAAFLAILVLIGFLL